MVGGVVEALLEIREPGAAAADNHLEMPDSGTEPPNKEDCNIHTRELFFTASPDKYVLVISTPFRKGSHVAQRPNDFLPIIEHLEKLHEAGYVHGDIRARNTLFPEEEGDPGYLIDFDFSGKAGTVCYPTGYVRGLDDGDRRGFENENIEKWQDWFAFGRLMFDIHQFVPPGEGEFLMDYYLCKDYWMHVKACPPPHKNEELKKFLSRLQENGWTVMAGGRYQAWLDRD
jgi:serine/threonine protein kinase